MLKINKIARIGLDEMPKRDYVCKRLGLMTGTLNLLCGAGYSSKTLCGQMLGICVSERVPFLGHAVNGGSVVHLDQEQDEYTTQFRYERIAAGLGTNITQITRCVMGTRLDDPKKGDEEYALLLEACKGARLVIADSLKALTVADENSSDIERPLRKLKALAEQTKAAVLLIHHKGKTVGNAKQSGRGSSAIYDAVDVQWDLDVDDGKFTLTCKKNRCGMPLPELSYRLVDAGADVPDHDTTEQLLFDLVSMNNEREKLVLDRLRENGVANYRQLKEVIPTQSTLDATLSKLLETGLITERKGARNARIFEPVIVHGDETTSTH